METNAPPVVGHGRFRYQWRDDWARPPASSRSNGRTHAAAVLADGRVAVFHQADPAVLLCDAGGTVTAAWGDYPGAHGLTLVTEPTGEQALWLTDEAAGVVRKHAADGRLLQELPRPPDDRIDGGRYVPTWVAVGPDGDVWVADGYGSGLLFRYDAAGRYKSKLDGTNGVGRFKCPHGIAFDAVGRLWVADRGNRRVLVCDADGGVLRHSDAACHSPCGFAFHAGNAYVPELGAGLKILDADLNVLASIGDNAAVEEAEVRGGPTVAFWPNVPRSRLSPGTFNSPHGVAVGPDGSVYVAEWIVGGRVTKLEPLA